jgi:hypothetical protein
MHRSARVLFCAVAAVSAAALADPFVEAAANAGVFGRGDYTDHSMLDVVPALASAALLAFLYACLRARAIVIAKAQFATPFRALPMLPAIFGAQLVALYGMETLEQVTVAGRPLGGTLWLGAPVPIALAFHCAACIGAVLVLARLLERLTHVAVGAARFVRTMFVRRAFPHRLATRVGFERPCSARMHPLASRSGKRAPPFVLA